MSEPALAHRLGGAVEAAEAAGRRTLDWFGSGVRADTKADGTPVTVADRESERVLREAILRAFPDHAILGEEQGEIGGPSPYRWVLDPIDGTKSFVAGVPLYGVLVALEVRGDPQVGVIHMPALGETVAAARGLGCRWNGRPARVSTTARVEDALLCTTSERAGRRRSAGFTSLAESVLRTRGWGDCYAYALVATGRADIAIDPQMSVWDCAALVPVIEEAGGRFTDWRGARRADGGDAVATNGVLHESVLELLARSG